MDSGQAAAANTDLALHLLQCILVACTEMDGERKGASSAAGIAVCKKKASQLQAPATLLRRTRHHAALREQEVGQLADGARGGGPHRGADGLQIGIAQAHHCIEQQEQWVAG